LALGYIACDYRHRLQKSGVNKENVTNNTEEQPATDSQPKVPIDVAWIRATFHLEQLRETVETCKLAFDEKNFNGLCVPLAALSEMVITI
jgi:hypothetical protein